MSDPRVFTGTQTQLFAEYNRWMNESVYAAAATLTDEQRKQDLGAFFKSIHGTLEHLLWGDTAWMARFRNREMPQRPAGARLFESFDELRSARAERDRDIVEWAGTVTSEWLAGTTTWTSVMYARTFHHPNFALAAQLFNHQTHHRGQVTTLLMQLGVDPGVTDIPLMPALNQ